MIASIPNIIKSSFIRFWSFKKAHNPLDTIDLTRFDMGIGTPTPQILTAKTAWPQQISWHRRGVIQNDADSVVANRPLLQ